MKGEAYSALARYYEYLMDNCDYEKWSQYVCGEVLKYAPIKNGADCACGSGYFTRALKKAGCSVFGSDVSEEMLTAAKNVSLAEGLNIEYRLQDMTKFKSFTDLGFITVINDGINYLSPSGFIKAVKAFRSALMRGGFLLFDISSEYKLKNVIGNNMFGEDLDDLTYLWFNTLYEDRVKMELTVFARDGEIYKREDETHVQYVRSVESVRSTLTDNGFEIIEICGKNGEKLTETSERINFLARRK